MTSKTITLVDLPTELIEEIYGYLDSHDTCSLRLACQALHTKTEGHLAAAIRSPVVDWPCRRKLRTLDALLRRFECNPAPKIVLLGLATHGKHYVRGWAQKVTHPNSDMLANLADIFKAITRGSGSVLESLTLGVDNRDRFPTAAFLSATARARMTHPRSVKGPEPSSEWRGDRLRGFKELPYVNEAVMDKYKEVLHKRFGWNPGSYEKLRPSYKPAWEAAACVFEATLLALARSGIAVRHFDVFGSTIYCSLATDRLAGMLRRDGLWSSRVRHELRSLSISISHGYPHEDHLTLNSLNGHPEALGKLLRYFASLEKLELHYFHMSEAWKSSGNHESRSFVEIAGLDDLSKLHTCFLRGVCVSSTSLIRFIQSKPNLHTFGLELVHLETGDFGPVFDALAGKLELLTLGHLTFKRWTTYNKTFDIEFLVSDWTDEEMGMSEDGVLILRGKSAKQNVNEWAREGSGVHVPGRKHVLRVQYGSPSRLVI